MSITFRAEVTKGEEDGSKEKKDPTFLQSAGFLIDKDAHKNPNFTVFKFESASLDFLLASC